jgi:hypothetical protein
MFLKDCHLCSIVLIAIVWIWFATKLSCVGDLVLSVVLLKLWTFFFLDGARV